MCVFVLTRHGYTVSIDLSRIQRVYPFLTGSNFENGPERSTSISRKSREVFALNLKHVDTSKSDSYRALYENQYAKFIYESTDSLCIAKTVNKLFNYIEKWNSNTLNQISEERPGKISV